MNAAVGDVVAEIVNAVAEIVNTVAKTKREPHLQKAQPQDVFKRVPATVLIRILQMAGFASLMRLAIASKSVRRYLRCDLPNYHLACVTRSAHALSRDRVQRYLVGQSWMLTKLPGYFNISMLERAVRNSIDITPFMTHITDKTPLRGKTIINLLSKAQRTKINKRNTQILVSHLTDEVSGVSATTLHNAIDNLCQWNHLPVLEKLIGQTPEFTLPAYFDLVRNIDQYELMLKHSPDVRKIPFHACVPGKESFNLLKHCVFRLGDRFSIAVLRNTHSNNGNINHDGFFSICRHQLTHHLRIVAKHLTPVEWQLASMMFTGSAAEFVRKLEQSMS
jgi:hypothetical protein